MAPIGLKKDSQLKLSRFSLSLVVAAGRWMAVAFCFAAFWVSPAHSLALPDVRAADLPLAARETVVLIRKGGPFPYQRDGVTFSNGEKLLPPRERGWYREYT